MILDIAYYIGAFLQHRDYLTWRLTVKLDERDPLSMIIYERRKRNRKSFYTMWSSDIIGLKYFKDRGILMDKEFTMWFNKKKLHIAEFYRIDDNTFIHYKEDQGILLTKDGYFHYNIEDGSITSATLAIYNSSVEYRLGLFSHDLIVLNNSRYSLHCPPKSLKYKLMEHGIVQLEYIV